MKTALLVMVHGSPRPTANTPMLAVLDRVRARGAFEIVQPAFMECNAPSIPEAIALCVEHGAGRIVAVPYFLHTGSHVAEDLPRYLDEARVRYPGVEFLLGDYLGRSTRLTDVLAERAAAARSSGP